MRHRLLSNWRGLAVTAVAVVMTLGLVAGSVMAQTPPTTPTPGTAATRPAPPITASDFLTRLAAKLGIGVDRVQTAAKEAQTEMIDAAVQAGTLPAEAATRLKERVNAGDLVIGHGRGGKGGPGGPGGPGRGPGFEPQALATFLGITPEQLRTELTGKSLAQVAQAHGKSRDQLITFVTDQHKARLAEAEAAGRLTQAQADQMQQQFTQNVGQMVDKVHSQAGAPGERRGPGGPGGPNGSGTPGTPRATVTPSA
ncbi:MAG: hypothetical protein IT340_17495 [Chloroflexi bacterium]|nr:hypothetical protein [Chloroflexota bacterium]